jgi:hypothetical protein
MRKGVNVNGRSEGGSPGLKSRSSAPDLPAALPQQAQLQQQKQLTQQQPKLRKQQQLQRLMQQLLSLPQQCNSKKSAHDTAYPAAADR